MGSASLGGSKQPGTGGGGSSLVAGGGGIGGAVLGSSGSGVPSSYYNFGAGAGQASLEASPRYTSPGAPDLLSTSPFAIGGYLPSIGVGGRFLTQPQSQGPIDIFTARQLIEPGLFAEPEPDANAGRPGTRGLLIFFAILIGAKYL